MARVAIQSWQYCNYTVVFRGQRCQSTGLPWKPPELTGNYDVNGIPHFYIDQTFIFSTHGRRPYSFADVVERRLHFITILRYRDNSCFNIDAFNNCGNYTIKMEDYQNLLRDLQWLSIRPKVDEELRVLFDSVVKMYLEWERSLNGFQCLELRILCLKSMQNTSMVYKHSLRFPTVRIDFSDPFTRWSYMFVFMLRHVHLVFYAFDQAVHEKILKVNPSGQPTNVCMIGGGPGSDVLGLGLFLMKHGCTSLLTDQVNVLDKCYEWSDSWSQLHRFLPERYSKGIPDVKYHRFDYLNNQLSLEQRRCVKDADIVTMIKSLSPVAAWLKAKPKHHSYVREAYGQLQCVISEWHSVFEIMKAMKPGAFLLYIDNETGPQREILMNTVKVLKFELLFDRVFRDVRMPSHFFSSTSRDLMNTFNYKPCTTAGTNEVIILKKEGPYA